MVKVQSVELACSIKAETRSGGSSNSPDPSQEVIWVHEESVVEAQQEVVWIHGPAPTRGGGGTTSTEAHSNYRADVDGLRAFAVVSVILFHFDSTWLPGGFVGVDVRMLSAAFPPWRCAR